jgi:hypothetical protein
MLYTQIPAAASMIHTDKKKKKKKKGIFFLKT